ncbi:hypothetical protein ACH82I_15440 [Brevibacterium sp. GP-SGM9]|uniref:hypothetical protein n=1 Tax=Brevibacterium sp. GP-SGM9 TaxID=3376990 RepID=UPI0039A5D07F|nr:hypothetical protein [Brevibacterium sp. CCUG 69071]
MFNIAYFQDLRCAGVTTTRIRAALSCCLLRLGHGVYSVIRRCGNPGHAVFATFIDNEDWIRFHAEGKPRDSGQRARYSEHLDRLRVLSYPNYRPDDVVWSVSAARVHRIGLFDAPVRPISVINPRFRTMNRTIRRHKRPVPAEDTCVFENIVSTTPARTALDLNADLSPAAGFAAMEQVLRRHMLGDDEDLIFRLGYPPNLEAEVPAAVRSLFASPVARLSSGRKRAEKLGGLISPLSESYAESRASLNLHLLGLHDFVQQFEVRDGRRKLTRLDFLLKNARVALYVDGTQKYVDTGFDAMNKESRQHNRLLALGFKVIRFKFNEVLGLQTFSQKLFSQAPELRGQCGCRLKL